MTVFKAYLKVLNKNKWMVILYTVILIFFAGFNMKTSDTRGFVTEKPDILIVNEDENIGITKHFINYIKENSNIKEIKEDENARNDALFYRDVNYIIYIPKNFRIDFLEGKNPEIKVKSTGDYMAFLSEMLVERYFKIANIYKSIETNEEKLEMLIENTLQKETEVEMTSKLDTDTLTKAAYFYNFANYSILAGSVFVICFIISSFKEEKVRKRTIVSSHNYKKYNRELLLSNSLFAFTLWLFYVLLSFILVGKAMLTSHGIVMILNSFVFSFTSLTLAFFIGNLISNKEAISGIVNVIALGSSFLCGAFVPMEFLPDFVITISHILPSYYYISNNEMVKTLEIISLESLQPFFINIGMMLLFSLLFIVLTNIVTKRKSS